MNFKYPEWKQTLGILLCLGFVFSGLPGRSQQPSCTDASLLANYHSGSFGNALDLSSPQSVTTPDNGSVFFINKDLLSNGVVIDSLLVFKLDATGSVVWSKAIPESTPVLMMQFNQMIALHNGNILLAGNAANIGNNTGPAFSILLLLDATGNVLWQKNYAGLALVVCNEGLNGEITVAGWAPGKVLITRLSPDGNIIWSKNYQSSNWHFSINPGGLYSDNGRLYVGGDYYDPFFPDISIGFWLLKLDYQTGEVIGSNSWKTTLTTFPCELDLSPGATMTATAGDHLLLSASLIRPTGCQSWNILFARVDSNLQLVPAGTGSFFYTVSNPEGASLAVNPSSGGIAFGLNEKGASPGAYYSLLDSNLNITTQRFVAASDPSANPIPVFDGYNLTGMQAGLQSGNGSYQFLRIDPGFTVSSACMGTPAGLLQAGPMITTPSGLQFTLNGGNAISSTTFPITQQDFSITTDVFCRQVSTCDSLLIHGDTSFCPGDRTAVFTAHKSATCLKQNSWQIDTSAWTIISQPNDTTIQLGLNRQWQGYIYATIAGCGLKDSLPVTIHGQTPPVQLPPDTVICPGTTMLLQPKGSFQTYRWQDGSVADHYLVKDTGLFYVTVTDLCGNSSSDTIRVGDCRDELLFPNAFTPNRDGANDLFRPRVNGKLKEFEMVIYNRWGQLIFQSADPANGWDGTLDGKRLNPGVFVWFCRYQFANDTPKTEKGTVLLIR
ncbi:gliding motility-associated C-terminal domain-containing protein [Puia dinghuensis]|uniref:Gliding motility-associated C-terminal domain-containing protein n=1 Tax=Puia dinghuensis TaxID=1792502 RepID=A0A8J2UED0_9BACT|nr:gliding motility-associated C-terminal domain-containing protein [Puia dinghuensis]GGB04982.1 hypothetical protein GCM10011511_30380 [Puia dinghuensis]